MLTGSEQEFHCEVKRNWRNCISKLHFRPQHCYIDYFLSLSCLSRSFTNQTMSSKLVPLTVIKGAANRTLPLPNGENGGTGDIHSIQTDTKDSKCYFTSGFYRITEGPARPAHYDFEETKMILNGEIDILDEATGIQHHCVPGDFIFFYVGSKVQFSSKSEGSAFYAVTRPVRNPHLVGEAEKQARARSKL